MKTEAWPKKGRKARFELATFGRAAGADALSAELLPRPLYDRNAGKALKLAILSVPARGQARSKHGPILWR